MDMTRSGLTVPGTITNFCCSSGIALFPGEGLEPSRRDILTDVTVVWKLLFFLCVGLDVEYGGWREAAVRHNDTVAPLTNQTSSPVTDNKVLICNPRTLSQFHGRTTQPYSDQFFLYQARD